MTPEEWADRRRHGDRFYGKEGRLLCETGQIK
jgi:hypothetical protein